MKHEILTIIPNGTTQDEDRIVFLERLLDDGAEIVNATGSKYEIVYVLKMTHAIHRIHFGERRYSRGN